ncbi:MAG: hypothetical protein IJS94_01110 [Clostridia bacterium]|nr:hypothetical protein [Clostridia bacterium]
MKNPKGVLGLIVRKTYEHAPLILTCVGIGGMLGTVVMSVKATPKAMRLIEEKEIEKEDALTPVEVVKTTWKCYIPAGITGALSIACLIAANSVNAKRRTALATACTLSETALREYQKKTLETVGEKKEREIRDSIAEDKVKKDPPEKKEVYVTPKGSTLCYDVTSGRYFTSDIEKIRKIINDLNRRMITEMYISLNELYTELDLKSTSVGDDIGWNIEKGYIEDAFSSTLTEDGTPCLVMAFRNGPFYGFDKF